VNSVRLKHIIFEPLVCHTSPGAMISTHISTLCFLLGTLLAGVQAASSGGTAKLASVPTAAAVPDRAPVKLHGAAAPIGLARTSSKAPLLAGEDDAKVSAPADGGSSWEGKFAEGLGYSKQACDASETEAGSWQLDSDGSMAAVPKQMLLAETLLREAAAEAFPEKKRTEKYAELALRLYNHGKWLAERNLAKAAEWRYRESSRIAKEAKRSVLAAHSLSRLGYFLMYWRRFDEAREVLLASEKLSTKANPLAPFLYGLLERQVAGADLERLLAAEERILQSGKQPSEELEAQREAMVSDITYWRSAETSPIRCLDTDNAANVLICLCSHIALALQRAFTW